MTAARRARGGQRGFTLVELMVALVVSSLLVGMLFAIFIRMSVAYRGQQQVSEVQGKLAAARARIEIDAKQAGLAMANGFHLATLDPSFVQPPLRVIDNADAPDEVAFYYADTSAKAVVVQDGPCNRRQCRKLASTEGFAVGDLVVVSMMSWALGPAGSGAAQIASFEACVLQLSNVGPDSFEFSQVSPWGSPGNLFCQNDPAPGTMFYKLVVRHWRIDPARPADGVLQLSTQGALVGVADWQDQAYGFTDLQVATRLYEPSAAPQRGWYSGEEQETATAPALPSADARVPIQVSISLVARTERDVEGVASSSTPSLTVAGYEDHNSIGNRAAIPLPSAEPALAGNRIYRYTTFQVDLRNLGVGR